MDIWIVFLIVFCTCVIVWQLMFIRAELRHIHNYNYHVANLLREEFDYNNYAWKLERIIVLLESIERTN